MPGGGMRPFDVGEFFRSMLLEGWDAITATLRRRADIDDSSAAALNGRGCTSPGVGERVST